MESITRSVPSLQALPGSHINPESDAPVIPEEEASDEVKDGGSDAPFESSNGSSDASVEDRTPLHDLLLGKERDISDPDKIASVLTERLGNFSE